MKHIRMIGRTKSRTIMLCVMMVLCFGMGAFAYQSDMMVSTAKERPSGEVSIRILIDERTLLLFSDGQVWKRYPIAIGKSSTPSPIGEWHIVWKDVNWGTGFGTRWMGLDVPWGTFGIHGTNKPWSIGESASHGCIRMQNQDVEELFEWVPLGTTVKIEGQTFLGQTRLQYPMAGQAVVALQLKLRELGYLSGRADGRYGKGVEEAVKALQRQWDLPETGIADESLLRQIQEASSRG